MNFTDQSPQAQTWMEAESFCGNHGSHLPSIKNQIENAYIHSRIPRRPLWIGLSGRKKIVNGQAAERYSWTDQSSLSYKSANWDTQMESKTQASDCVTLQTDLGWRKESCLTENAYICKSPGNFNFFLLITVYGSERSTMLSKHGSSNPP